MPHRPTPAYSRTRALIHPRYWSTWLAVAALRVFALLPMWLSWVVGAALGELLYHLHRPRRHVALVNVRKCFPELSPQQQGRIVRRHFHAFGQSALDMGVAWWASARRLRRLVKFNGWEHYERACTDGKNIILLVPHFLGLEIGLICLSHERPMCAVFRHVDNQVLRAIMQQQRARFGLVLVEYNKPLRALVRNVRAGLPLCYLPDQDPRRRASAFVPFFGIQTATFTTIGRLAKLTDAIVIPCLCQQLPRGRGYEVVFKPPLADFPTKDLLQDATVMNREIERAVREAPHQYFWMHRRFKTRPPGEVSFYK